MIIFLDIDGVVTSARDVCQECKWDGGDGQTENLVFHGRVIYYCPIHDSFQDWYFDRKANQYWRRDGEQWQN